MLKAADADEPRDDAGLHYGLFSSKLQAAYAKGPRDATDLPLPGTQAFDLRQIIKQGLPRAADER